MADAEFAVLNPPYRVVEKYINCVAPTTEIINCTRITRYFIVPRFSLRRVRPTHRSFPKIATGPIDCHATPFGAQGAPYDTTNLLLFPIFPA